MRSIILITLIGCLNAGVAQKDSTIKSVEFQLWSEIGLRNSFKTPDLSIPINHLIQFHESNINLKVLSINFIFYKNLGLNVELEHILFTTNNYEQSFTNYLAEKYNNRYYIDENNTTVNEVEDVDTYNFFKLGLNYRFVMKNLEVYPTIGISPRTIGLASFSQNFKERNTHNYLNYSLLPENSQKSYKTIEYFAGMKLGWRMRRVWLLSIMAHYSTFQLKASYEEVERDLLENTQTFNEYNYDNRIQSYNFGIGIIFELSKL